LTTGPNANRFRLARTLNGNRPVAGWFTLLELVLVMVIICTVLAMAAPSLRGFFASRQTADAAAQIVALTRLARSRAVAEGRPYRLNFDPQAGTYWLTAQEGGTFQRPRCEFGRVFSLPEGTVVSWEEPHDAACCAYIQFYPSGRTEANTIRLTGRQGEVVEITCPSPTELYRVVVPAQRSGL